MELPIHYRSTQKGCLLNAKSLAERTSLRRKIQDIKSGKTQKTRTSVSAKTRPSSIFAAAQLPVPSPSPQPDEPASVSHVPPDNQPFDSKEEDGGDGDPLFDIVDRGKEEEERQSTGKTKFTVKVGFMRMVKAPAMGEYITDAVMR